MLQKQGDGLKSSNFASSQNRQKGSRNFEFQISSIEKATGGIDYSTDQLIAEVQSKMSSKLEPDMLESHEQHRLRLQPIHTKLDHQKVPVED